MLHTDQQKTVQTPFMTDALGSGCEDTLHITIQVIHGAHMKSMKTSRTASRIQEGPTRHAKATPVPAKSTPKVVLEPTTKILWKYFVIGTPKMSSYASDNIAPMRRRDLVCSDRTPQSNIWSTQKEVKTHPGAYQERSLAASRDREPYYSENELPCR